MTPGKRLLMPLSGAWFLMGGVVAALPKPDDWDAARMVVYTIASGVAAGGSIGLGLFLINLSLAEERPQC